ncbi:MAG: carbon-nitrogen hydrolase family protein [Campylobacterota bacterium]
MKITTVQTAPAENAVEKNYTKIQEAITRAAAGGSDLVVFPEACLSGYVYASRQEVAANAFFADDAILLRLHDLCRRKNICALVGYFEKEGTKLFNTVELFGAKTSVKYRKVHLPRLGGDRFCDSGDLGFINFELQGINIGLNLCYDLRFCEAARVCALQGADLIIIPTNEPVQAYKLYELLLPARAFENGVHCLWVNRVGYSGGYEFFGKSALINPEGEAVFALDAQVCSRDHTLHVGKSRRKTFVKGEYEIDLFAHRSPGDYGPICKK